MREQTKWKEEAKRWRLAAALRLNELALTQGKCAVLEKEVEEWKGMVAEKQAEAEQWKAESERWRVVSVEKAGECQELRRWKKEATEMLGKWYAVDEFVRQDPRLTIGDSVVDACLSALKRERVCGHLQMASNEEAVHLQMMCDEKERVATCDADAAAKSLGLPKGALSAWKNYDHTAEIEAIRDELARSQSVIAEKERELERKSQEKEAQKILEEIFADLDSLCGNPVKECADGMREAMEKSVEEVQPASVPNVVINIYL